jgi:hypothetical protein
LAASRTSKLAPEFFFFFFFFFFVISRFIVLFQNSPKYFCIEKYAGVLKCIIISLCHMILLTTRMLQNLQWYIQQSERV